MKKAITIFPAAKAKFSSRETSNSITYRFRNIDPTKEQMFVDNAAASPLVRGDSYVFDARLKFPYYYFTLSIRPYSAPKNFIDVWVNNSIKAKYTVDGFGKIVSTNGTRMGEHKVIFDINLNENKRYYVTFKDFFLTTWYCWLFKLG